MKITHVLIATTLLIGSSIAAPDYAGRNAVVKPDGQPTQVVSEKTSASIKSAEARLHALKKYFVNKSPDDVSRSLNGLGTINSSGQRLNEQELKSEISAGDRLILVVDSIIKVDTKISSNAEKNVSTFAEFKDADGKPVIDHIVNALKADKDHPVRVSYKVKVPAESGPILKEVNAVAVSSTFLVGKKNPYGKKFFAMVVYSD